MAETLEDKINILLDDIACWIREEQIRRVAIFARQQRAEVVDEFVRRATDYAQSIPWNDRVDKSAALGIAILVAREMKEAYERKT